MFIIAQSLRALILATIAHLNKSSMYKYTLYIVVGLGFNFFSFSQAEKNNLADGVTINQNQVTEKEKKFIRLYFEAEKYKLLEDYRQAIDNYQKCISILPNEPSPYFQIGRIQFYFLQAVDDAKESIKQAISLDKKNKWYYYELLSIYRLENDLIKQRDLYEELIDIQPENKNYYLATIQILRELKEFKKAEKFIKKTEKKYGPSTDLLLELKDIYLLQNNFQEAEKIGKKLIQRSPNYYNTLAQIYMHFSDYENAIIAYQELLKVYPDHEIGLIALYKIYVNKKDLYNQEEYLFKIAKNTSIKIDTKKEIFYNLIVNNNFNEYPRFKIIVEEIIKLNPQEPLFNLILGDIYTKEEDYKKAKKYYNLSLHSGLIKDDYVYTKLIEIYWLEKKISQVLATSELALERFPFNPMFYYYKSLALYSDKKYQLCIETLLIGKEYIYDNDLLVSDFYSMIGDNYHKLKEHKSSDEAYLTSLKYNPDNIFVLNNYSYYLSNREENLLLAKEMITRCVDLTKTNPNSSYLDTYAWVLYKLKEYKLAKNQIEKALLLRVDNAIIYEHYGDILYQLGLLKEAVLEWKKAYHLDNNNIDLKKKINNYRNNE